MKKKKELWKLIILVVYSRLLIFLILNAFFDSDHLIND
jgi:hypothetical protein